MPQNSQPKTWPLLRTMCCKKQHNRARDRTQQNGAWSESRTLAHVWSWSTWQWLALGMSTQRHQCTITPPQTPIQQLSLFHAEPPCCCCLLLSLSVAAVAGRGVVSYHVNGMELQGSTGRGHTIFVSVCLQAGSVAAVGVCWRNGCNARNSCHIWRNPPNRRLL